MEIRIISTSDTKRLKDANYYRYSNDSKHCCQHCNNYMKYEDEAFCMTNYKKVDDEVEAVWIAKIRNNYVCDSFKEKLDDEVISA